MKLIPQPHGGALRNGGTNKGGPGRPASEIRERCRGSFYERIPILEEIADAHVALRQKCEKCGHEPKDLVPEISTPQVSDRIRAITELGKIGLGADGDVNAAEIRNKLDRTLAVIGELLQPTEAQTVLMALRRVWAA